MKNLLLVLFGALSMTLSAQEQPPSFQGKFEAIDRLLEPPSPYRTASGAPGVDYWQQRADYMISAVLDEEDDILTGEETITYYNNSPDELKILWIQLEQNVNREGNEDFSNSRIQLGDSITTRNMQLLLRPDNFKAGTDILTVTDAQGSPIPYVINNTMMRLELTQPLKSGSSISFAIKWKNYITDRSLYVLSREGYEYFPEDDNKVFLMGHWFPRMAVYNDTEGWQNKQFQRLGEFALEFGDYVVSLTVPDDHVVAGTGALMNEDEVLSSEQRDRLKKARTSFDEPVMIVTPEEAKANQRSKGKRTKTWVFKAENVRDVAFASSRKFIWDAQAVQLPSNKVMAMSFYPNEGLPVWREESTNAIKQALEVYSEATFDYPYPVAISVNTSNIGIEYPMISFNGGRPTNGQISETARRRMTSTIVHEVGHNWFPMIVSSDERKWMWMDEGLNTYLHQRTLAERYPQWKSTTPKDIIDYMKGDPSVLRPTMVNSDNDLLSQMGSNFYTKPTVGFQMLRETIIGQELFDKAFKEYANRWKYKHPNPSDLFRTLEDQTAVDLDWFWKGWYYTTDVVDVNLAEVTWYQVQSPEMELENRKSKGKNVNIQGSGQTGMENGFGNGPQMISLTATPDADYRQFLSRVDDLAIRNQLENKHIYELVLQNEGGLVMPVIIYWEYVDGTSEREVLPAEIWRHNEYRVVRTFLKAKEVASIQIDPNQELPDVNLDNNAFPRANVSSRFDQFKQGKK